MIKRKIKRKKQTNYKLDLKIIKALDNLSAYYGCDKTTVIQTLIFRDALYNFSATELQETFEEDIERLMLVYAVNPKRPLITK